MPRINAGYNSYVQILQSSSTVGIQTETIHDARLIPLDGRPHLPANVRQWHGDSRGTWKGDTLEIDTTNYSAKGAVQGATEALHVVERFTRVGPDTLNWEITFNDPHTWSQPWTLMIPLKRSHRADLRVRVPRREHRVGGNSLRRSSGREGARRSKVDQAVGETAVLRSTFYAQRTDERRTKNAEGRIENEPPFCVVRPSDRAEFRYERRVIGFGELRVHAKRS